MTFHHAMHVQIVVAGLLGRFYDAAHYEMAGAEETWR
jgi:hypothetical protein